MNEARHHWLHAKFDIARMQRDIGDFAGGTGVIRRVARDDQSTARSACRSRSQTSRQKVPPIHGETFGDHCFGSN